MGDYTDFFRLMKFCHSAQVEILLQEAEAANEDGLFGFAAADLEEADDLHDQKETFKAGSRDGHNQRPDKNDRADGQKNLHHRELQRLANVETGIRGRIAGQKRDDDADGAQQIYEHGDHFVVGNVFGIKFRGMIIGIRGGSGLCRGLSRTAGRTENSVVFNGSIAIHTVFHNDFSFCFYRL